MLIGVHVYINVHISTKESGRCRKKENSDERTFVLFVLFVYTCVLDNHFDKRKPIRP